MRLCVCVAKHERCIGVYMAGYAGKHENTQPE